MTMESPEVETSGTQTELTSTNDTQSYTTVEVTAPEPEPIPKPKKTPAKEPEEPVKCELKAKGEFQAGTASLIVAKKCDVSCNRTQVIILEQHGRTFTYTRTAIGTVKKVD